MFLLTRRTEGQDLQTVDWNTEAKLPRNGHTGMALPRGLRSDLGTGASDVIQNLFPITRKATDRD
jgi:hypothetical protein